MKTVSIFLFVITISLNLFSQTNPGKFYGSTDGTESIDLQLGRNDGISSIRFYSSDGGSSYLRVHARRWGLGQTWSRESNGGVDKKVAYLYGAGSGSFYQLFGYSNDVKIQLHTYDDTYFNGGNFGIGTSSPLYHFHVVGSDRARFEQTTGIIDLVGYGSLGQAYDNSAGLFTSNKSTLIMTGLQGTGDIKFITRPSGYQARMIIKSDGKIGIGTTTPEALLTVAGNIKSQEVKVTVDAGQGPDYVFEEDYHLRSLEETEEYIKANKHLPEIPSAKVMESEGLNLKEMNLMLLQKVEELTLHLIDLNKRVQELEQENENLKKN